MFRRTKVLVKTKNLAEQGFFVGAGDQIRTDYLVITNDVLYLLSYTSVPNAYYYNSYRHDLQVLFAIKNGYI